MMIQAIPIVVGIILNTVILISYCIIVLKVRKHDVSAAFAILYFTKNNNSGTIKCRHSNYYRLCFDVLQWDYLSRLFFKLLLSSGGWYLMLVRAVDSFYGHVLAKDVCLNTT